MRMRCQLRWFGHQPLESDAQTTFSESLEQSQINKLLFRISAQRWRNQHYFFFWGGGKGAKKFFSRGKTLKKSSVLTTLYRKMPIFLDFAQSWEGKLKLEQGQEHVCWEMYPCATPSGGATTAAQL